MLIMAAFERWQRPFDTRRQKSDHLQVVDFTIIKGDVEVYDETMIAGTNTSISKIVPHKICCGTITFDTVYF